MSVRGCNDPALRECVETLGVRMCYVVLFLVSLYKYMGCFAVQIVGGFGMKKKESLKLNMYVPQNSTPLNVTTCTPLLHTGGSEIFQNKKQDKV